MQQATVVAVFVADFAYQAAPGGSELSYNLGDSIRIINSESEWWFGENIRTGERGWVAPSYGHLVESTSPFFNLSDKEKLERRKALFIEIVQAEANYINELYFFIQTLVNPMQSRDTPFKRTFMNEPAVAVSFTLLRDIYAASSGFQTGIQRAGSANQMAKCYVEFAPSLQLYSQYAAENAACLNSIKIFSRQLREFARENNLPEELSVESFLVLPLSHYPKYASNFQDFVWLTPSNRPEAQTLSSALQDLMVQTDKIDNTLNDLAASVKLLQLQNEFVGNPKIFTNTRKLIREGELERVRTTSGNVSVKKYYAHLFNDALIWSQRNNAGKYKLNKSFELNGASITMVNLAGYPNSFAITGLGTVEVFRAVKTEESQQWFSEIEKAINSFKTAKIEASVPDTVLSMSKMPSVKNLGARGSLVYKFLGAEMRLVELVNTLNNCIIKPLIEASRGGVLIIGKVGGPVKKGGHKIDPVSSASKVQIQAVTEALKASDIQIFLRAAESLNSSLKDFSENLKNICTNANWSENVTIGAAFNTPGARLLYSQYKSYATGQQKCLRVLKGPYFVNFYHDAEQALSGFPGSFADNLESPRNRPTQYLEFLNQLLQATPAKHPDRNELTNAAQQMSVVSADVDGVVKNTRNFEKLLEIQANLIVSSGMFGASNDSNNFVAKLASTDRRFIKEGDLKKVCRKKNKTFRFWLFNDFLCYGQSNGNSTFTFHRALDLSKCRVQEHNGEQTTKTHRHCFEILGAEKSFVVICASDTQKADWMEKINTCSTELKQALNVKDDSFHVAAVWQQDKGQYNCAICKNSFGIFRRRHHCRKCGKLICSEHSQNREILPNMDKTKKQRICDTCFKNPTPAPVLVSSPATSPKQSAPTSQLRAQSTQPQQQQSTPQQQSQKLSNQQQQQQQSQRTINLQKPPQGSPQSSQGSGRNSMNLTNPGKNPLVAPRGTSGKSDPPPLQQQQQQQNPRSGNNTPNSNNSNTQSTSPQSTRRPNNVPSAADAVVTKATFSNTPAYSVAVPVAQEVGDNRSNELTNQQKRLSRPVDVPVQNLSQPSQQLDPRFDPYYKLKSVLPEGTLRQRMKRDNFSDDDINSFFNGEVSSTSSRPTEDSYSQSATNSTGSGRFTAPPPPPPQQNSTSQTTSPTTSLKLVVPPPPRPTSKAYDEPPVAVSPPSEPNNFNNNNNNNNGYNDNNQSYEQEPVYTPPPPPVVVPQAPLVPPPPRSVPPPPPKPLSPPPITVPPPQPVVIASPPLSPRNDVEDDSFQVFQNPEPVPDITSNQPDFSSRPMMKPSFLTPESLTSVQLRSEPVGSASPAFKPPMSMLKPPSLLEALQQGNTNLKKVSSAADGSPPPQTVKAGAGNVLSMLADQMNKRRMYVKDNSDDESDSDDGFSSDED